MDCFDYNGGKDRGTWIVWIVEGVMIFDPRLR